MLLDYFSQFLFSFFLLTYNLRLLFLSSLFPLFFYEKNGPQIAKQGERSQEYNLRSLFQVRFVLLRF